MTILTPHSSLLTEVDTPNAIQQLNRAPNSTPPPFIKQEETADV